MIRLGIDIGGTKIRLGLYDGETLAAAEKLYVKDITDLCGDIRASVDALCAAAGVSRRDIVSCGVGVPGTVSEDGRTLLKAPNLALLTPDTADRLEKALGVPVRLVQDSRAAAWGEYTLGAGRGAKTLICFTLGTGIGTGIVLDGRIVNGALGGAGELGHICVEENGRPCGCGKRGCLEKYAAGIGLGMTAGELFGGAAEAEILFARAEAGNADAQAALDRAVTLLGRAVVSAVNLLSPDVVLFSGGLSARKTAYLDPLIAYVASHCYSSDGRLPKLGAAALGEDAPLAGAAMIGVNTGR